MAPTEDGATTTQDESLATRRSKRTKRQTGASTALEKIRRFRETGERSKFEVGAKEDIYDVVDEDSYSEIVRKRQEDDWVVDDGGVGYVDDGREIFDDDLEEASGKDQKASRPKDKKANVKKPVMKPKTIKNMFAASAKSKKVQSDTTSLGADDLLDDILKEVQNPRPASVKVSKSKSSLYSRTPTGSLGHTTTPRRLQESGSRSRQPIFMDDTRRTSKLKASNRPSQSASHLSQKRRVPRVEPEEPNGVDEESIEMDTDLDFTDSMQEAEDVSAGCDEGLEDAFGEEEDAATIEALSAAEESFTEKSAHTFKGETPAEDPIPRKTTELDCGSAWETIIGRDDSKEQIPVDVQVDSSSLPLQDVDGEKFLRFFWFDAYEDRFKQPGTVYLFGKVKIESANTYVSCCVAIKNIERQIFLLPRETRQNADGSDSGKLVEFMNLYEEFNERVATKYKIMKFICRRATKAYSFEIEGVPAESEYLEVRYSAEHPQLPSDLKGETFSHVFGTNTSSLELLLIGRKLKGPCWLNIKMPQLPSNPVSWCKVEAIVSKPDFVEIVTEQDPPPPMVVMSLCMRTVVNPRTHTHEILAVSALIHHRVHLDRAAPKQNFQDHFCAVSKPSDQMYPYDFKDLLKKKHIGMEVTTSERSLLGYVMAKIHKIDPDVLVGHDIHGFDLDVLLHRISACKIPHWSRLGRLKRNVMPKLSSGAGKGGGFQDRSVTCGRMVCDVKISSRELIRCKSYDLSELSMTILQSERENVDQDEILSKYNSSRELFHLFELTVVDSLLALRIMYELNVLPLALQITTLVGNVMARTLLGGRSERNEFLLLHAFSEKNFICPDKSYNKKNTSASDQDGEMETSSKKGRRKPAYAGGLVLEPKKGFYDKFILLLDFNSLYPSIIQEYNICFTTINRAPSSSTEGEDEDEIGELPDPGLEPGVLPTEIRKLVERRRQVKGMMKTVARDSDQYVQYDIRQKALKLTANSMYGCLGFSHSRFYAKPLAALVTSKGREILLKTKDLAQQLNLDVIYGDTDSIMINTNSTDLAEVRRIGNKVKSEVNKLYRLLEIDIDGIFKSMLLLKKKKYAAITVTENADGTLNEVKEMKGLDIVRRDWSDLAKDSGNYVLSQILSSQQREAIVENIHEYLITVGENVKDGKVSLEKYVINKQLTKAPNDYPDKKSLPHVHVAMWLLSKGRKVNVGDTIQYVICEDGSTLPASQRSYHPDEFRKSETLKIDCKYYLASQVHPVVARLCDPIDGTDAAHIAQCLGLDPSGYRHSSANNEDESDAMLGGQAQMTDDERFKDCVKVFVKCRAPDCGRESEMEGIFRPKECIPRVSAYCPHCRNMYKAAVIINQLTLAIRKHIKDYYTCWQVCEDPSCGHRTRRVPLLRQKGTPVCPHCYRAHIHPEYSDTALYNQVLYYARLFDLKHALKGCKSDFEKRALKVEVKEAKPFYDEIYASIEAFLQANAYSEVNLSKLFNSLF